MNSFFIGHVVQAIQEDRLADSTQSEQHNPLGRASIQQPIHVDRGILDQPVAAGQFQRLQSSNQAPQGLRLSKVTAVSRRTALFRTPEWLGVIEGL